MGETPNRDATGDSGNTEIGVQPVTPGQPLSDHGQPAAGGADAGTGTGTPAAEQPQPRRKRGRPSREERAARAVLAGDKSALVVPQEEGAEPYTPVSAVTASPESAPKVKPKKVKIADQLAQTVGLPFTAVGVALTLTGNPDAGNIWPLEKSEEQALADALVTAVGANDRITQALERASGGVSLAALFLAMGQILAPRVIATQQLIAMKRQEAQLYAARIPQPDPQPGTPAPAAPGGGSAPQDVAGNATAPAADGSWQRLPNGSFAVPRPEFAG